MQQDTKPKPSVLGAETVKVADLVSYQEGSIVSREILKKPTALWSLLSTKGKA